MKLYKYRPVNGYTHAIFAERDFWASTPHRLNDPFDCEPFFEISATMESFREHLESTLSNSHPSLTTQQLQARVDEIVLKDWPLSQEARNGFLEQYRQRIRRVGVISFSERWDSIVMWSHYACEHRGICIEVETDSLPKDSQPEAVSYLGRRPSMNLITDHKHANRTTVLSKNKEWSYEQEWRFVLEGNRTMHSPPCAVSFPEGFITGVLLGARMTDKARDRVIHWSNLLQPRPILYETSLHDREYRMDRSPFAVSSTD